MNMIQKTRHLEITINKSVANQYSQTNHPRSFYKRVSWMILYSQKIPSKVLNSKESLFLEGLQTVVAATDSDDVQQLQYLLPSIRYSLHHNENIHL
jgi:hypothetical protein